MWSPIDLKYENNIHLLPKQPNHGHPDHQDHSDYNHDHHKDDLITYRRAMVWFLLRNQPPSSQRPGRSQAGPDNTIVTDTGLI